MKRFYTAVTVVPEGAGFCIHLDNKAVKTPSRHVLLSPTRPLAEKIATEWKAQGETIIPDTMPLTQILTTVIDSAGAGRTAMEDEVLGYLDTDLIFYRTVEPHDVAVLQAKIWGRWKAWLEQKSGVSLLTTTTLEVLAQPVEAHDYAARSVRGSDDYRFAAIQMVTAISGSIVLALAFADGAASADDVYEAAQLEENYRSALYNEAFYGKAPHQEKAQAAMIRDLQALTIFLGSLA